MTAKRAGFVCILIMLAVAVFAQSTTYEAKGLGETELLARQDALSSLIQQLNISISTRTGGATIVEEGSKSSTLDVAVITDTLTESRMSLIGLKFVTAQPSSRTANLWEVAVTLDPKTASNLYIARLTDLVEKQKILAAKILDRPPTEIPIVLSQIATVNRDYEDTIIVARLIGIPMSSIPQLTFTKVDYQKALELSQNQAESIEEAAKIIAEKLYSTLKQLKGRIYVSTLDPVDRGEGTNFNAAFQFRLLSALIDLGVAVSVRQDSAAYMIKGTYVALNEESVETSLIELRVEVVPSQTAQTATPVKALSLVVTGEALLRYRW